MKPGRELDALVAEKVMGWKRMTEGEVHPYTFDEVYPCAAAAGFDRSRVSAWWFDPRRVNEKGEPEAMRVAEDEGDPDYEFPVFAPSTDIADAWQVVERMRRDGFHVGIADNRPNTWWVDLTPDASVSGECTSAEGATAPLTICLAALKVIGASARTA